MGAGGGGGGGRGGAFFFCGRMHQRSASLMLFHLVSNNVSIMVRNSLVAKGDPSGTVQSERGKSSDSGNIFFTLGNVSLIS